MAAEIDNEILELERAFWAGDRAFFARNTDDACLVAFPQMAQRMTRDELAATAGDGNRWRDLHMHVKGAVEPAPGILMLTYEARAVRSGGEPYAALVSTGYVKRPDGWKMMFHAHAPLEGAG